MTNLARSALLLLLLTSLSACGQHSRWQPLPSLPLPIANNAVTSIVHGGDRATVYSFMGITDPTDDATITGASFRLDLPGGSWERIADAPPLEGRAKIGASAISVGDRIFLLGGYTVSDDGETTEKRFFEYVPESNSYARLADVPVEVDDTVLGVWRDRFIYAISGWHGPTQTNILGVQFYDIQADQWSPATPMPAPSPGLFGHSGAIVGDTIIICDGAAIEPRDQGRAFVISDRVFVGTIDANEPAKIAWREIEAHPGRPTYRGAASQCATADGRMLLVGGTDNPYNISATGYDGESAMPLDQVLAFDPETGAWETLEASGPWPATMDHRGLVWVGENSWAIIGGMTAPGEATGACWRLSAP